MPDVIATGEQNINSPLPLDYPYICQIALNRVPIFALKVSPVG